MKIVEVNVLVLAYLGDTIYENYVRHFLVNRGFTHVKDLQRESIKYVSAKSQSFYLKKMIDNSFLNDEELDIVKRARNYKTTSHPKNCDIITYKYATGLEALIGYLDLNQDYNRVAEIMHFILENIVC